MNDLDSSEHSEFLNAEFVLSLLLIVAALIFDFAAIFWRPDNQTALLGVVLGILNAAGVIAVVQYLSKYRKKEPKDVEIGP